MECNKPLSVLLNSLLFVVCQNHRFSTERHYATINYCPGHFKSSARKGYCNANGLVRVFIDQTICFSWPVSRPKIVSGRIIDKYHLRAVLITDPGRTCKRVSFLTGRHRREERQRQQKCH